MGSIAAWDDNLSRSTGHPRIFSENLGQRTSMFFSKENPSFPGGRRGGTGSQSPEHPALSVRLVSGCHSPRSTLGRWRFDCIPAIAVRGALNHSTSNCLTYTFDLRGVTTLRSLSRAVAATTGHLRPVSRNAPAGTAHFPHNLHSPNHLQQSAHRRSHLGLQPDRGNTFTHAAPAPMRTCSLDADDLAKAV
jgi:hypothetical protein